MGLNCTLSSANYVHSSRHLGDLSVATLDLKKKSKTEWFELQNHIRNDAIHPQKIWESRTVHFSQEQREGLWFVPKQEAVIGR